MLAFHFPLEVIKKMLSEQANKPQGPVHWLGNPILPNSESSHSEGVYRRERRFGRSADGRSSGSDDGESPSDSRRGRFKSTQSADEAMDKHRQRQKERLDAAAAKRAAMKVPAPAPASSRRIDPFGFPRR